MTQCVQGVPKACHRDQIIRAYHTSATFWAKRLAVLGVRMWAKGLVQLYRLGITNLARGQHHDWQLDLYHTRGSHMGKRAMEKIRNGCITTAISVGPQVG